MKNKLQQCLLFGRIRGLCPNILESELCTKANGEFPLKRDISYVMLLTLILLLSSNSNLLAQNGEAVNEGVFKIEPATIVSSESDFTNEQTGDLTNDGDFILRANFSNYGAVGFSPLAEGYTRFVGYSEQELSGSNPINLNNVLFENQITGISFLLDNDVNIYGVADFTWGIVDNTNYIGHLTFYENADNINTSDNSHVNGPVYKIGNKDFTFPIGKDGFYRWAGLSRMEDNSAIYKATYFLENSDEIHPHDLKSAGIIEIDNQEYWILDKETSTDEEVLISLSWNEETTPSSIYEAAADDGIIIVRWDEQSNMWVDEGGVVDRDNKSVTTAIKKDGLFTLGRIDSDITLPCDIIIYNAVTPNGDGINDYFRIDVGTEDCVKNLNVMIFNRWGVKVFETNNYGPRGDIFDGFSSGRLTLGNNNRLPSGTYYYILDYQYQSDSKVNQHRKAGYLNLSGN